MVNSPEIVFGLFGLSPPEFWMCKLSEENLTLTHFETDFNKFESTSHIFEFHNIDHYWLSIILTRRSRTLKDNIINTHCIIDCSIFTKTNIKRWTDIRLYTNFISNKHITTNFDGSQWNCLQEHHISSTFSW